MPTPTEIRTDAAPAAVGPYAQARVAGLLVFVSGQLPLEPGSGRMPDGIEAQAQQALANLEAILAAAGSSLSQVLKTTVYLADIADFAAVNEVYGRVFAAPFPARSCFAVRDLPRGAKVEIEAVAAL